MKCNMHFKYYACEMGSHLGKCVQLLVLCILQLEIRIELNCVVCDHGCRIRDICLRMIHGINLDEH